ncbi:NfeD family protein [Tibeticola sp.]|uniref:NfeD family protein n=1 Tax=Tibeticola sp. TaxID=2005368 RepID=UPI00258B3BDE|nr:NfeD family protein [Tibeticola sp.]MCI4441102.1 NfeD family protein [Tibeticola sp.]
MAQSTVWWLMAGSAVVMELLTGTFYLLMLALGLAAGALAAHAGAGTTGQLVAAALVGSGAVVGWYLRDRRHAGDPSPRGLRSVNLDIGEIVHIDAWNPDGSAQVRYRGANWTAQRRGDLPATTGPHRVVELVGNRLLVEPVASPAASTTDH